MADKDYDKLIEQSLDNALEDRKLAKEAYEHMKSIFEIDKDNPETMQAVMLTGAQAVKLLESMSRSNEQVIKLAQMRQKDDPKKDDEEEESQILDVDDIRKMLEKKVAK